LGFFFFFLWGKFNLQAFLRFRMDFSKNRICQLFQIQYPIIQAGMVWCSGWRLASAVSNQGGLGIIGAGSMYPEVFRQHIQKCKAATNKPFGVNIPLLYSDIEELISILEDEKVKIVFTSAGNPRTWTPTLKKLGCTVVHVVASQKFAKKAEEAGVDGLVAEGFEAGGHNGREEITTFNLIPAIRQISNLPLMAAGGVFCGASILGAMALGAEGVQIGTLFAVSEESSAHEVYKKMVLDSVEGDTKLMLKALHPVRLLRSPFFEAVEKAESQAASVEELKVLLGRARAKKGIFEGNVEEGEFEVGQVAAYLDSVKPVSAIMADLLKELGEAKQNLNFQLGPVKFL
jgi:enoyl-[acyl-carrier protein] reductase II